MIDSRSNNAMIGPTSFSTPSGLPGMIGLFLLVDAASVWILFTRGSLERNQTLADRTSRCRDTKVPRPSRRALVCMYI